MHFINICTEPGPTLKRPALSTGKFIAPLASPLSGSLLGRLYTVITTPYTGNHLFTISRRINAELRTLQACTSHSLICSALPQWATIFHEVPTSTKNTGLCCTERAVLKTRRSNSLSTGLVPVTQGRVGSVSEHCTKWPVSQFPQIPHSRLLSLISVGFITPISLRGEKKGISAGGGGNHHLSLRQMKTAFTVLHTHTHTSSQSSGWRKHKLGKLQTLSWAVYILIREDGHGGGVI